MSVKCETSLLARARLLDQIDALADRLPRASHAQIAQAVDKIRSDAQHSQLIAVAEVARGMERALAGARSLHFATPFIDAMRDLAGCERAEPQVAEAFLASISQRLYG
jgi:predicted transcriptional regulator